MRPQTNKVTGTFSTPLKPACAYGTLHVYMYLFTQVSVVCVPGPRLLYTSLTVPVQFVCIFKLLHCICSPFWHYSADISLFAALTIQVRTASGGGCESSSFGYASLFVENISLYLCRHMLTVSCIQGLTVGKTTG